jgi:hypothetical protein
MPRLRLRQIGLALPLALLATGQASADWQRVDDVGGYLSGTQVDFPGVSQIFGADGDTFYGPSAGRWAARDGRYCSVWPPVRTWVCYGLFRDGNRIRFVAPDGTATDGTRRP